VLYSVGFRRMECVRTGRRRRASGVGSVLLTGIGLAAPAGLNAYLPLLIVALAGRFTDLIVLERPYDFLSSAWGIAIIVFLLTIELVVDKIPGIDHANDLIQSAIRPAAGAILMMAANSETTELNPVVAMVIGLLIAGAVHIGKATTRPVITVTTGGVGNPVVSMIEDAVAALTAIVALLVPFLVLFIIILVGALFFWMSRALRRRRGRRWTLLVPPTLRQ
jgi:uncharacterized membrane protein